MQRQNLSQESIDFVQTKRAHHHSEAESGADDSFADKDRRDREHVLGPLSRVKRDDDVLIGTEVIRVIGPARDEGWFYGLSETPWGNFDVPYSGAGITDRAPADPNEEPLPIYLEEAPEPEPEQ